jgi:glyoxylase-like metal-dependent hydrolase (beta-lactamase superfamily II)/rhodanese-related sulfurtransferase
VIFRQLFDSVSSTYTYLLASRAGGEGLIIDPVLDKVERYLTLLKELDLKLIKALDTHVHADHITGLGELRDRTRCITVMGAESDVDVVSMRVADGDKIEIEGIALTALHTPGHTQDSYCFLMDDRIFTGDTLLIRGTGRTDFQSGDPGAQYDALFGKILTLPDDTLVYPGHDYKGDTVSTIGEEKAHNPRLQVTGKDQYIEMMNNLNLPNPKMMDVAVPANLQIGMVQDTIDAKGWSVDCGDGKELLAREDILLVDLRDKLERQRHGEIPGSLHAAYGEIEDHIRPGGLIHELANATGKRIVFYCAFGERSAMAVQAAQNAGLRNSCHIRGGLDAWRKRDNPVTKP